KPITGRGEWGVRYPAYEQPGFGIVLAGRCWLAVGAAEPILVERGDFLLLPSSPAFTMASRPGAPCRPGQPSFAPVRHGDPEGAPDFEMLGGTFRMDPVNTSLLLAFLPETILIRAAHGRAERLARIV